MNLSAFGVESADFPSITANIDLLNDSAKCIRSYYDPEFLGSVYRLTSDEIGKIRTLADSTDWEKTNKEYTTSATDQPTSTTIIYTSCKKICDQRLRP